VTKFFARCSSARAPDNSGQRSRALLIDKARLGFNEIMIDIRHVCFDAAPVRPKRTGPPIVSALQAGSAPPQPAGARIADVPLDPLLHWLLNAAELNPSAYRASALQRRLTACLRSLRVKTSAEARRVLELQPHLRATALNVALIGVTEFFRDSAVFEALRLQVLPALLRAKPGLRVLSAGCSGGHELYSVAMLLDQAGVLESSELVGIDCRTAAIAQASAGIYEAHETAGLPGALHERFLTRQGQQWHVCDTLKRRTRWICADLMAMDASHPYDVVLYRNVAIYLAHDHVDKTWDRIVAQVAPGGCLITGKAEQPPPRLGLSRMSPCIHLKSPATSTP
jgi:chemotaxis protein methyltransferase CheR